MPKNGINNKWINGMPVLGNRPDSSKEYIKLRGLPVIWKSRHWHLGISIIIGIVIGIGIAKNLFLPLEFFLKKYNLFVLSCA